MMTDQHANFISAILSQPDRDLPRLVYADWLEETDGMEVCKKCRGRGHAPSPDWDLSDCSACLCTGEVSNGHAERAEFIRCQVELAAKSCRKCKDTGLRPNPVTLNPISSKVYCGCDKVNRARMHALRRRERELQHIHAMEWIEPQTMKDDSVHWHASMGANVDRDETARWWQGWSSGNRYIDADFSRGFVEAITCSWQDWQRHAAAIRRATPLREVTIQAQDGDVIDVARWPEIKFNVTNRSGSVTVANDRPLQPAGR